MPAMMVELHYNSHLAHRGGQRKTIWQKALANVFVDKWVRNDMKILIKLASGAYPRSHLNYTPAHACWNDCNYSKLVTLTKVRYDIKLLH